MYAKVFAQIFDSSIADDFRLRHFFMDLLVLADMNGVVDMTPTAIAARTRIPLDDVLAMLAKLEQPDAESRTPDADGRRIERLDEHRTWGWHIINYSRFREIASEEQRREKTRERVATFRLKRQQKPPCNAPVTLANACNAMQRQRQKQIQKKKKTGQKTAALRRRVDSSKRIPADINEAYQFAAENRIERDVVLRWWKLNEGKGWRIHTSWRAALREFADKCAMTHGAVAVPIGYQPAAPVETTGDEIPPE